MRSVVMPVKLSLTEKERLELGEKAGTLSANLDAARSAFAEMRDGWKEQIDALVDQLHEVLAALHSGKIERTVECQVVYDKSTRMIQHLYQGEIVSEKPATEDDLQMEIEA